MNRVTKSASCLNESFWIRNELLKLERKRLVDVQMSLRYDTVSLVAYSLQPVQKQHVHLLWLQDFGPVSLPNIDTRTAAL